MDPQPARKPTLRYPSVADLLLFAFFAGLLLLVAWIAATGRVAYMFVMLLIAAALAYALVDLVDYEIVKRRRR